MSTPPMSRPELSDEELAHITQTLFDVLPGAPLFDNVPSDWTWGELVQAVATQLTGAPTEALVAPREVDVTAADGRFLGRLPFADAWAWAHTRISLLEAALRGDSEALEVIGAERAAGEREEGREPRYVLSAKAMRHVEIGCPLPPGHDEPCVAPQQCDRCDGCGWYEGGAKLKTICEQCGGTGMRPMRVGDRETP